MHLSFTIERSNGASGKTYSVEGDVIVFGRSDQSDVLLDDVFVSASHAQIIRVASDFYLQDLNSTNGTFVNAQRIKGQVVVLENTVIEFGQGGPRVRVLSLSLAAPVASVASERPLVNTPVRSSFVADKADDHSASAGKVADSPNLTFHKPAYLAVGCLVLLLGFFASRVLFPPSPSGPSAEMTQSTESAAISSAAVSQPREVPATVDSSVPLGAPVSDESRLSEPDIDYTALAASVRDRAVWVGVKVSIDGQELVIPYNSGWLLSSSRIVTTASTVVGLQSLKTEGVIVVFSHLLPESAGFIEVAHLGVHPEFSVTETSSSSSQSNNVGWLELASPVPLPPGSLSAIADNEEWKQSFADEKNCRSIACGYVITSRDAVSPLKMPQYAWTRIAVTESVAGGASLQTLPMIRIPIPKSRPVSNGQFVINSAGKFVGTLSRVNENTVSMIPADRIQHLMASPGSPAQ